MNGLPPGWAYPHEPCAVPVTLFPNLGSQFPGTWEQAEKGMGQGTKEVGRKDDGEICLAFISLQLSGKPEGGREGQHWSSEQGGESTEARLVHQSRDPGPSQLCEMAAAGPDTSHVTSLCLSFSNCKIGISNSTEL